MNYLHSHGLAHTELRLENVHVSPVDRHIKVSVMLLFGVLEVQLTAKTLTRQLFQ